MKKKLLIFCLAVSMLMQLSTACSTTKIVGPKKAPPGQVKKATGSQSAKPYAPGQQKKKK